ncbi:hypothetical protein MBBAR_1c02680 [Methanobrevibacter arboriphilus JCM 13429 = DSM 1125]|uniref:Uncharacterized protein n=1 Tax=Methanobrevibacter arboriphilus JCM 13429 = DSM 1125 TaxID=1300164 RepID=A0A1V6N5C0_METAZ|nr:hypothetical protein [Methanobrevibacter arboriphilus]OQD59859.1 hypothetical protein MBBAR_1c02680 [Methanobrevibacter arboriphilus JCM 13429 = DSM 1125]
MRYFTKKNYTKPSPSGTIALNDYYIILINKKLVRLDTPVRNFFLIHVYTLYTNILEV